MKVSRTKEFTSSSVALKSLEYFVNTARKREEGKPSHSVIGIGKSYFTSRPPDLITAHGYAQTVAEEVSVARNLDGSAAVLTTLKEHICGLSAEKQEGRWVRLVLTFNPEKIAGDTHWMVDIDRLITRSIETAVRSIEQHFHPTDRLSYVLGIDHQHAAIDTNPRRRRSEIQAHVYFLPNTEKGEPFKLSHLTQPLQGSKSTLLTVIESDGTEAVRRTKYELIGWLKQPVDDDAGSGLPPELQGDFLSTPLFQYHILDPLEPRNIKPWKALVKECAYHATDDIQSGPKLALERKRQVILDKFSYYLTTSTQKYLHNRYHHRMTIFANMRRMTWADTVKLLDDSIANATDVMTRHTEEMPGFADYLMREPPYAVRIWDRTSKALTLKKPPSLQPTRRDQIENMFEEMRIRRHAYRVHLIGVLAEMEIAVGRIIGETPEWMKILSDLDTGMRGMPNLDILRPETK